MRILWTTADHCGGVLYGPYTRKEAFAIQAEMRGESVCDRQDVFLVMDILGKSIRLIRFKCKGETE